MDPYRVTVPSNYLKGGSGKYAQYFFGAGEEALTWQDSKASRAINTLSGEAGEPCGEAIPCAW